MKTKVIILIALLSALLLIIEVFRKNVSPTFYGINEGLTLRHKTEIMNYFYEPKPGIHTVTLPGANPNGPRKPTYKINSDTLNQTNLVTVSKPARVFRIATLGDSFTFGFNINTEDNYPSQLQEIVDRSCKERKIEIINLGAPGYDLGYSVERYRIRGKKYNPDLILWFIIGDDIQRYNEKYMPKLYNAISELRKNNLLLPVMRSRNFLNIVLLIRQKIIHEIGGEQKLLGLQKDYISSLGKYFNKKVFFFVDSGMPKNYRDILKDAISKHKNYNFYDKLPALSFNNGTSLIDGHPSPKGSRLIAEDLFKYLVANKLIPCKN